MTRAPRRGTLGAFMASAIALTAIAPFANAQQAATAASLDVVAPAAPAGPPQAVAPAAQATPSGTPLALRPDSKAAPLALKNESPRNSMATTLGIVLAALLGGAWLWKKSRERASTTGPAPSLRVVSRLNVGYRSELLVVDLEGRRMLLGMTPGSIQALTELPDEGERDELRDELALGPDVTFSDSLRTAAGNPARRTVATRTPNGPPSGRWVEDRADGGRTPAEGPSSRRMAAEPPASRRMETREGLGAYDAPLEQQVRGLARRKGPRDA